MILLLGHIPLDLQLCLQSWWWGWSCMSKEVQERAEEHQWKLWCCLPWPGVFWGRRLGPSCQLGVHNSDESRTLAHEYTYFRRHWLKFQGVVADKLWYGCSLFILNIVTALYTNDLIRKNKNFTVYGSILLGGTQRTKRLNRDTEDGLETQQPSAGAIFSYFDSRDNWESVALWENLIWDKREKQKHCSQTKTTSNTNMLKSFPSLFSGDTECTVAYMHACMHAKGFWINP